MLQINHEARVFFIDMLVNTPYRQTALASLPGFGLKEWKITPRECLVIEIKMAYYQFGLKNLSTVRRVQAYHHVVADILWDTVLTLPSPRPTFITPV